MEFGFWSVVPPVVTIALALIIKNVFVALFVGITLALAHTERLERIYGNQRRFLQHRPHL